MDGDGSDSGNDGVDTTSGEGECGNGELEGNEVCDDGTNDGSYGGCMPGCGELGPRCGDGILHEDAGEVCDDGNTEEDETCPSNCGLPGGTVLWEQVYDPRAPGGAASDSGVSIAALPDGGFVVSGVLHATFVAGAAHPGFYSQWEGVGWLRRYSSVGATLWNETVDLADGSAASGRDNVLSVAADGENIYAAVSSYQLANGSIYTYSMEDGAFGYSRDFMGYGLKGRTEGGYLVAGLYGGDALRAYDGNGTEVWADNFASNVALCADVTTAGDGTIYAVCADGTNDFDQSDVVLIKLAANGDSAWSEAQSSLGRGTGVAATSDGGVALLGESNGNILLTKVNAEGSAEWTHSYGEPDDAADWSSSVVALESGEVVWGGYHLAPMAEGYPAWNGYLQKVDASGEPVWTLTTSDASLPPNAIADMDVGSDGSIIVTGWIANEDTDSTAVWLGRISP